MPEFTRQQATLLGFKAAFDGTILRHTGSHDYRTTTSPETKCEQPLTIVVHLFYITTMILEINLLIKTNKDRKGRLPVLIINRFTS